MVFMSMSNQNTFDTVNVFYDIGIIRNNIIKAIDTPVLTVFLTLISFKNILEIKTTTLIIKKTTLTF